MAHTLSQKKVALVTGGNRGIGFEVGRQLADKGFEVILTGRDEEQGMQAARTIIDEGGDAHFHHLDVTDPESIVRIKRWIEDRFKRLDVLVNNAGVFLENSEDIGSTRAEDVSVEVIEKTLETNLLGPYQMCQTFIPMMRRLGSGRIINVSSGMGQLQEMEGQWPGYRISKAALNVLTRIFADELKEVGIQVNSVCPGWVKTNMGGPDAERSPAQGADTIVWLATLDTDRVPSGRFFRDRKEIAW